MGARAHALGKNRMTVLFSWLTLLTHSQGSGKTTLLQRLHIYTAEKGIRSYFINLDPAVKQVKALSSFFFSLSLSLFSWETSF